MAISGSTPLDSGASGAAVGRAGRPGVAFFARDLKVGGAERVFLDFVAHARSVRPIVVLRRREGGLLAGVPESVPLFDLATAGSKPVKAAIPIPGTVVAARTGLKPGSLLQLVQECARLRRIVEATGSRVVSSFLMRSHIVALLTKRLLAPDLRVVLNVHEHMSGSAAHLYPKPLDRLAMRWVTRRLFPLADRIVVVAESLRRDLVENFRLPAHRIVVVHNPIRAQQIRRMAEEEAPECGAGDGLLLVGVGRLVHLKGFDILIRALARVPEPLGARLVLVGDGPERGALETLARECGLSDRVRLVGMQSNPWKYMARATALVVPSRTEAFPNVIGEALALGVPVLAADCSAGIGEYLENGRCGVMVPPDDDRALAAAIVRLVEDPTLRDRLAENGTGRMGGLELQTIIDRYESLLCDVAGG